MNPKSDLALDPHPITAICSLNPGMDTDSSGAKIATQFSCGTNCTRIEVHDDAGLNGPIPYLLPFAGDRLLGRFPAHGFEVWYS